MKKHIQKWLMVLMIGSSLTGSLYAEAVPKPSSIPSATQKPGEKPQEMAKPSEKPSAMPHPSGKPQEMAKPSEKPSAMPHPSGKPQEMAKPSEKPSAMPHPSGKPQEMAKPSEKPSAMPHPSGKPQEIVKPGCKPTQPPLQNGSCPNKCQQNQSNQFVLDHFKVIAQALKHFGVSENQLAQYIKEGKKLEEVLVAEKIKPKRFKCQVVKEYQKVIDQGVKENKLTKEQACQLKAAIKKTVKNWFPKK